MIKRLFKTMAAVLAIAAAAAGPVRGQQQTYTVTFTGFSYEHMNTTVSDATMPYSINEIDDSYIALFNVTSNMEGEIITSLSVTGGDGKVSVSQDGGPFMILTITGAFEGTAQVHCEGTYNDPNFFDPQPVSGDFYVTCVANVAPSPHTVRMAAGTEEAANWSIASGNASVPGTQVLENVMSGSQVTATYNGTTKKVKSVKAVKFVAVQSIVLDKQTANLAKDSTMTLNVASVLPENAADKSYTWSSDNTSVATVNATTGVVTGMAAGTANIIATANDGSGVKDTCVVTVLNSAILDGVTVLYASDYGLETWSTVVGYNPGVMYQDGDYVKLTSNGAFLCHDGHPMYVDDNAYPPFYDCQWLFLTNIDGANFIYRQGETWQQAIDAGRLDNDNWSTEGGQVKYHNIQILLDSNYEPVDPTATIDPSTVVYHLGFLND